MLTEAQNIIVKEICSIQFTALNNIFMETDLGEDEVGESYEDVFANMGCSRKDFDEELMGVIDKFQEVHDDPEKIYTFEELDMIVFRHILHNFRHKWEDKYPKALENLWNKLFIWTISNELHNKQ